MSKQSPCRHSICCATPYIAALCLAHDTAWASFSMAIMRAHLLDLAKAMVFPPAPENTSTRIVLSAGV